MILPQPNIKESMVTYVNKLETLSNEINEFPDQMYLEIAKLNIEGAVINGVATKSVS